MNDVTLFDQSKFDHAVKVAGTLAKSNIVPASFRGKPEDIFACIVMGAELGISPMQSLNAICMIQGQATLKANTMISIVRAKAPHCHLVIELDEVNLIAKVTAARDKKDISQAYVATWDMKKAEAMGLSKKDNYQKQPITMLKWRAVSEAIRVVFGDLLMGLNSFEEFLDIEGKPITYAPTFADSKAMLEADFPISEEEKKPGPNYRFQNGKFRGKQMKDVDKKELNLYMLQLDSRKDQKEWEKEIFNAISSYLNIERLAETINEVEF